MTSRNIAVRKEIYDALRRERRSGESFTRVIQRLLNRGGTIEELQGSWGSIHASRDTSHLERLRGG